MVVSTKRTTSPSKIAEANSTVWLSSREAAERLGLTPKTLLNWRASQRPDQPPFYKQAGPSGRVRYKLHEIDQWLEASRRVF